MENCRKSKREKYMESDKKEKEENEGKIKNKESEKEIYHDRKE